MLGGLIVKYCKIIENGYIACVGTDISGEEISREEYEHILSVIHSAPKAESGFRYHLKMDLTWEQIEVPPMEGDPEITEYEALEIILGGKV
jgi:hypothetical protein